MKRHSSWHSTVSFPGSLRPKPSCHMLKSTYLSPWSYIGILSEERVPGFQGLRVTRLLLITHVLSGMILLVQASARVLHQHRRPVEHKDEPELPLPQKIRGTQMSGEAIYCKTNPNRCVQACPRSMEDSNKEPELVGRLLKLQNLPPIDTP